METVLPVGIAIVNRAKKGHIDKIFDGLWNDKKETYVTISEPYDMATL